MKKKKRIAIRSDEFDILSATWILSCNDENPSMSYEGIRYRLGLPTDYDIKGLIQSHGELFRKGIPRHRLEGWKDQMRLGKHLPAWMREIDDEITRKAKVEALDPEDIFRSQFRTEYDAPQSPVEVIDWGLQHIDRLRKANLEYREQTAKRWEIWLVFSVSIINIIVSILIASLE